MGPGRGVSLHHWPEAAELGAAVAVTTRHGGLSVSPYASLNLGLHVGDVPDRVIANRERAARAFGVDLGALVFAHQVHGAGVTVVGAADRGRGAYRLDEAVAATDILVTTEPATVMVILVADCAPIALIDPEARVLAAVHAGWRGTAAGAVGRALDAMAELGGRNRSRRGVHRARRRTGSLPGGRGGAASSDRGRGAARAPSGRRPPGRPRALAGRPGGGQSTAAAPGRGAAGPDHRGRHVHLE